MIKRQLRGIRPAYKSYHFLRNQCLLWIWELKGRPAPPPPKFKQNCVRRYRKLYNLSILIETGTYLGEMITATCSEFAEIYSIELSDDLYQRACVLFAHVPKVHLLHGDSGSILTDVLQDIAQPCLFWLDAHYSGTGTARGSNETPILLELGYVLSHPVKSHVILVDDARCFVGNGIYPALAELERFVRECDGDYSFEVVDDIIRILLPSAVAKV